MKTDDVSKRYYRENAAQYAADVRDPQKSLWHAYYEKPAMYGLLPELEGKSVLSIGCGSGEDSAHLMQNGAARSVGVDLSPELIAIAREAYPACEFHVMDMLELDFPSESFDFAYSSLAIHYVGDWERVFKCVYSLLKPESYFLLSCVHPMRLTFESMYDEMAEQEIDRIRTDEARAGSQGRDIRMAGDYFSREKLKYYLGKNDIVYIWRMSLNDMANAMVSAGFLVAKIVEPKPLSDMERYDAASYRRLSKVPEFIIFELYKPQGCSSQTDARVRVAEP